MRNEASGRGTLWRPLGTHEVLGDTDVTPGALRCSVHYCSMQHSDDSVYCYYHNKVQTGAIDSFLTLNSAGSWEEVSPLHVFPVWPLPKSGYVWLADDAVAA